MLTLRFIWQASSNQGQASVCTMLTKAVESGKTLLQTMSKHLTHPHIIKPFYDGATQQSTMTHHKQI
jgi:hypothetical protein